MTDTRMSDNGQSQEEQRPPTKRRRAALACSSCRVRKSRCDGGRPKCSMCQDLGFDCRYQPSAAHSNVIVGKEYLASMEDRLRAVEQRLSSIDHRNAAPTTISSSSGTICSPGVAHYHVYQSQINTSQAGYEGVSQASTTATVEPVSRLHAESASGGVGVVTLDMNQDCVFYGPSSNNALLREMSKALGRSGSTGHPWVPSIMLDLPATSIELTAPHITLVAAPDPSLVTKSTSTHASLSPSGKLLSEANKSDIHALPTLSIAQELIDRFFADTGQMFPFIHEHSFRNRYNLVIRGSDAAVSRTWLGLLNMVFAMAITVGLSPDMESRTSESEVFRQRASSLCSEQINMAEGLDIDAVHFLLLLAMYLQGTQKSVQGWMALGNAVKVAIQLGLHSSEASRGYSALEQETRKRTWFACIILDRTSSVAFGRPSTLPAMDVKLSLPAPYSFIASSDLSSDMIDALSVGFFNSTITLYRVLAAVIDELFEQNLGSNTAHHLEDFVSRIVKLEGMLHQWQRNSCSRPILVAAELPTEIERAENADSRRADALGQDVDAESSMDILAIQELRLRAIISLRYNHVNILIHRPILSRLLRKVSDTECSMEDFSGAHHAGYGSIQKCFQSSKETINLVSTLVHSKGLTRRVLGAWWFWLYYTFNASLVIAAAALVTSEDEIGLAQSLITYQQDNRHCLQQAIRTFEHLDSNNRMVTRCKNYLIQLVQTLDSLLSSRAQRIGIKFHTNIAHDNVGTSSMSRGNFVGLSVIGSQTELCPNKPGSSAAESVDLFPVDDLTFLNDHMFPFEQDPFSI